MSKISSLLLIIALSIALLVSAQGELHACSLESSHALVFIENDDSESNCLDYAVILDRIYGALKKQNKSLDPPSDKRLRSSCWAHAPPANEN